MGLGEMILTRAIRDYMDPQKSETPVSVVREAAHKYFDYRWGTDKRPHAADAARIADAKAFCLVAVQACGVAIQTEGFPELCDTCRVRFSCLAEDRHDRIAAMQKVLKDVQRERLGL